MSLSASISLNGISNAQVGQIVNAVITVSNSNVSATSVLYILPQIFQTGNSLPVDRSTWSGGPVAGVGNIPVPAGGSEIFVMPIVFQTPSLILDGAIQTTYTIGCLIAGSDGSVFSPTPVTISITGVNPYS
jgi:hypothetical protein